MRILIVEDEEAIAWQIRRLLGDWGHEVAGSVGSGLLALEHVQRHPPDLILINLHLAGDMDGVELTGRLQARWDIPIVMVSGSDPEELPEELLGRPGLMFLAKPFLPFQLREIIGAALL